MRKLKQKQKNYLYYLLTVFFITITSTLLAYKADIKYVIEANYVLNEPTYAEEYLKLKNNEAVIGVEISQEEKNLEKISTKPNKESAQKEEIRKIEDIYVRSALLIGDSMLQVGVGSTLENYFKTNNVEPVTREAVQSTGLLHPERLDWFSRVDQLMSGQNYDIIFIFWGLNDDDHIKKSDGNWVRFSTPEWETEYSRLISQMIEKITVQHQGKVLVWIGLPIVKDESWDWKVRLFNKLYKNEAEKYHNVIYIDSYALFSQDGVYTPTLTNKAGETKVARHTDHLHLNSFGGAILADHTIDQLLDTQVKFGPQPVDDLNVQ